jgi:hypothetical protein
MRVRYPQFEDKGTEGATSGQTLCSFSLWMFRIAVIVSKE